MSLASHSPEEAPSVTLYRHSRRPAWGVAVPTWETATNQAFRFEDGRTRVFKKDFMHLLEPVDGDADDVPQRIRTDLRRAAKASESRPKSGRVKVIPFKSQLEVFTQEFPDGFAGEDWTTTYRDAQDRTLKRHRQPVLDLAQNRLAKDELAGLVAADRAGEIVDRVVEVLGATDLVQRKRADALDRLSGDNRDRVGRAADHLLWGDEAFEDRFRAWIEALRSTLGTKLSWRFATSLSALVHPDEHPCIRHSVVAKQAALFAPDASCPKRPGRVAYQTLREVILRTRQRLEKEGFKPRDLLDVHDFMWLTLRPAAIQQMKL